MKKTKRDKINLLFSSFLVIGYIICSYFFSTLAAQVGGVWGGVIQALILIVFGLLLFYATRVGEGSQVKRFSPAVLILVVLPALYIVLAAIFTAIPFPSFIRLNSESGAPGIIFALAGVALGYGIPYTFLSGYEISEEEDVEEEIEKTEKVLEGGLAEELAETQAQEDSGAAETAVEAPAEEAEETPAEEAKEAAADEATAANTETPDAE